MQENNRNLALLSESYIKGKLSHAYILEGDALSGKEKFAHDIAATLLCNNLQQLMGRGQSTVLKACGTCPSCIKAATGNHPDIINVTHVKDTVLSVAEIREQVVSDMAIKPYYGPYKIYIIGDAQLMNESAQNALLKTIEEPAGYGLIFLLTDNADSFLQTIRSRCIRLSMDTADRNVTAASLLDEDGRQVISAITQIGDMSALQINKISKEFEGMDQQKVVRIMKLWFRDVLVYKSTADVGRLYFMEFRRDISQSADRMSYEKINSCLTAVDEVDVRLKASVKAEAAFENLLLRIRRESK